ncbi:hypothetical protein C8R45DRAFT_106307 [Mycena sanguinolenta]|nr:hypothetical protein C8R45DRAFT_106307 [Mycena sanguinolenta]
MMNNMTNIQWGLDEIQSPTAGRKSSPGNARAIDPAPVVQLRCTVDPRMIPGFKKLELVCKADLFRVPDGPTANRWSYYGQDGTRDKNQNPVYAVFFSDYRPPDVDFIGSHLLPDDSKETHLLLRNTVSQAVEIPQDGSIVFAFPGLAVVQTGRYLLRYTLYNRRTNELVAKCFGQTFKIYPVNTFPGVQPPTPLSQLLGSLKVVGFQCR